VTAFRLVGNNGYSVQDSPEPEAWVRPILDAGLRHLEYFVDHMDPVIFENVIRNRSGYFRATMDTIRGHGLTVISATTGRISYLLNVLSHPYPDAREEGIRWCERMVDLAVALGARFASGHFDYISQTDLRRGSRRAEMRMLDGLLRVAEYGADKGLEGICLEQMHGPQLRPYTVEQAQRYLRWLNRRSAIPVYLLADCGHMAHVPPSDPKHTDTDKDPCHWLSQKYAGMDKIFVHLQQSDAKASRHWPFTPRYNRRGIISPERVIESIEASGVAEAYLSFEILYPRGADVDVIADDLRVSADRFRRALKSRGYVEREGRWTRDPRA